VPVEVPGDVEVLRGLVDELGSSNDFPRLTVIDRVKEGGVIDRIKMYLEGRKTLNRKEGGGAGKYKGPGPNGTLGLDRDDFFPEPVKVRDARLLDGVAMDPPAEHRFRMGFDFYKLYLRVHNVAINPNRKPHHQAFWDDLNDEDGGIRTWADVRAGLAGPSGDKVEKETLRDQLDRKEGEISRLKGYVSLVVDTFTKYSAVAFKNHAVTAEHAILYTDMNVKEKRLLDKILELAKGVDVDESEVQLPDRWSAVENPNEDEDEDEGEDEVGSKRSAAQRTPITQSKKPCPGAPGRSSGSNSTPNGPVLSPLDMLAGSDTNMA
jgi:hypothetical protein